MRRPGSGVLVHVREALVSVGARPGRLVLTMLGEALGLAALVATVGLAGTAGAQVAERFDGATATQVTVAPADDRLERGATLPADAERRVEQLEGVESAGTITGIEVTVPTRSTLVVDPQGLPDPVLPVVAASTGLFETVGAEVAGRAYDAGHETRADAVAMLGAAAAERLGIHDLARGPAVFVGDVPLTVVGIIEDVDRRGDLLDAVVVPEPTAARLFGWAGAVNLEVEVRPNAAEAVARLAPLAVSPIDPAGVVGSAPPADAALREGVQGDVSSLLVVLGIVTLVAGGVGIANIMLLSVMERVGEIGLRRSLGATRAGLMTQFLVESATIGLLGGLVGTSVGFVTTMAVSISRDWTPVLDPVLLGAPVAGLVVGVLAGAFPSWRAGSLEPADALRRL